MALFKKNDSNYGKKGFLAIPETMYDAPFANIIACMDPDYLEDAVLYDFDKIIPHRKADEYRYFRMYPSWISLFGEKLHEIMCNHIEHFCDFKKIIEYFPEYVVDVYEFLIESYIMLDNITQEMDIIEDVLIPIADLERYQNHYFPVIRKRALELLEASESYTVMWDMLQVFEQYYDMPRKIFNDYLEQSFVDLIINFNEKDWVRHNCAVIYGEEDYHILSEAFKDRETYEFFMNNLPRLIIDNGLDLYTMLIKILGPNKEVLALHDYCAQFMPFEERECDKGCECDCGDECCTHECCMCAHDD